MNLATLNIARYYGFDQKRGNRRVHQAVHTERIHPVPAPGSPEQADKMGYTIELPVEYLEEDEKAWHMPLLLTTS